MQSFRVDKVLGTSTGSASRLGQMVLSVPSINVSRDEKSIICSTEEGVTSDTGDRSTYSTPMYLMHTQSGSVPHVVPDVLNLIYPSNAGNPAPPVQISIDSTIKFLEPLQKFGKHIGEFIGLPGVPTFLTIHDPLQILKSGHNDKFGVSMWSRHGRTALTLDRYALAFGCYQPSLCQILSDYDVNMTSSGLKRLKKSLSRAEEYTAFALKEKETFLAARKPAHAAQIPGFFITVESAWFEMDENLAENTVKSLLESRHQIQGIVIAGFVDCFHKPGPLPKNQDSRRMGECKVSIPRQVNYDLLDKIIRILPADLPKYVPGPFQLAQMVCLISKGVDILDTSVVSKMANDAEAFILDEMEAIMASLSLSTQSLQSHGCESLAEHLKTNTTEQEDASKFLAKDELSESCVISLRDKRFFDDFRPLSSTCVCYSCRKHTRSYIHHLYSTDELLGPVLLQIHNLTAIDRFFQVIRGIIQDSDSPKCLEQKFTKIQNLLKHPVDSDNAFSTECENHHQENKLNIL